MTHILILISYLDQKKTFLGKIWPQMQFLQLESLWKMRSSDLVTVFKKYLFCLTKSVELKKNLVNTSK